jgi:hypothetical protein
VRAISARVSDVPGVRTVEVDLAAGTVRVTGTADPAAVRAAISQAGHYVTPPPAGRGPTSPPHRLRPSAPEGEQV